MQYSNKVKHLKLPCIILIFISHSSTDSHAHSLFTDKLTDKMSQFIKVIITCKKKIYKAFKIQKENIQYKIKLLFFGKSHNDFWYKIHTSLFRKI